MIQVSAWTLPLWGPVTLEEPSASLGLYLSICEMEVILPALWSCYGNKNPTPVIKGGPDPGQMLPW